VVEPEPIMYRDEVVAMLLTINDMKLSLEKLVRLLGGEDGEEAPPDDV
jgi:hypothetical protein